MRILRLLRSLLAYSLCFAGVLIVMATFLGLNSWAALLVNSTGLKISPWITGGEISRTLEHDGHAMRIYRPVFRGLLGQRDEGFVQLEWAPKASVPDAIDENVDLDGNGSADVRVQWRPRAAAPVLTPLGADVTGLRSHHELSDRFALRVNLRNSAR